MLWRNVNVFMACNALKYILSIFMRIQLIKEWTQSRSQTVHKFHKLALLCAFHPLVLAQWKNENFKFLSQFSKKKLFVFYIHVELCEFLLRLCTHILKGHENFIKIPFLACVNMYSMRLRQICVYEQIRDDSHETFNWCSLRSRSASS